MFANLFRSAKSRTPFSGPVGERLYAVGDVHGRLDLIDDILARIVIDLETRPVGFARLAFLGDFIDRGPDSAGVLQRLVSLRNSNVSTHLLMGNHEEMLLRALSGEPGMTYDWLRYGGDICAQSYGLAVADLDTLDETQIVHQLHQNIPNDHIDLLNNLEISARFGDFLLVHAGIRPGVAIEDQRPVDLRWIRQPFLDDRRNHGVVVVHGHTVRETVDLRLNRIGIDTGAYMTDNLTAVVIQESDIRFLCTRD